MNLIHVCVQKMMKGSPFYITLCLGNLWEYELGFSGEIERRGRSEHGGEKDWGRGRGRNRGHVERAKVKKNKILKSGGMKLKRIWMKYSRQ